MMGNGRALVVDIPMVAETLAMVLEHEGYPAFTATNFREAEEVLRRYSFAIVIFDPAAGTWRECARMVHAARNSHPQPRLLAFSTFLMPSESARLRNLQVDRVEQKPVEIAQLREALQEPGSELPRAA